MVTVIAGTHELSERLDQQLGISPWLEVGQDMIDAFADTTDDRQWIHVDAERATAGPYGATVAHGYLILALLPALTAQAYRVDDVGARVNYGLDRVRFPGAVRAGSRVRLIARLAAVEEDDRGTRVVVDNLIEVEGSDRPACIARTVTLLTR